MRNALSVVLVLWSASVFGQLSKTEERISAAVDQFTKENLKLWEEAVKEENMRSSKEAYVYVDLVSAAKRSIRDDCDVC